MSLVVPWSRTDAEVDALQVDLLYLHNAAEGHQIPLGKVAFMSTLKLAFAVLEKFRCFSSPFKNSDEQSTV